MQGMSSIFIRNCFHVNGAKCCNCVLEWLPYCECNFTCCPVMTQVACVHSFSIQPCTHAAEDPCRRGSAGKQYFLWGRVHPGVPKISQFDLTKRKKIQDSNILYAVVLQFVTKICARLTEDFQVCSDEDVCVFDRASVHSTIFMSNIHQLHCPIS